MKFRDAMVDVFRNLFSWLKDQNDKENIEYLVTLIGCLAFVFIPCIIPFSIMAFFEIKDVVPWLLCVGFLFFWVFYSKKVIMKWGES